MIKSLGVIDYALKVYNQHIIPNLGERCLGGLRLTD